MPPPSVDIPQPCYSALALDIDGTITTADARVVYGLVQEARLAGSHVAINTARTQPHWKHAQTPATYYSLTQPPDACAWQPSQARARTA